MIQNDTVRQLAKRRRRQSVAVKYFLIQGADGGNNITKIIELLSTGQLLIVPIYLRLRVTSMLRKNIVFSKNYPKDQTLI